MPMKQNLNFHRVRYIRICLTLQGQCQCAILQSWSFHMLLNEGSSHKYHLTECLTRCVDSKSLHLLLSKEELSIQVFAGTIRRYVTEYRRLLVGLQYLYDAGIFTMKR